MKIRVVGSALKIYYFDGEKRNKSKAKNSHRELMPIIFDLELTLEKARSGIKAIC